MSTMMLSIAKDNNYKKLINIIENYNNLLYNKQKEREK